MPALPYPTLPLPGLDIRTELKGVFFSLLGLNLAVFIFLFSAGTMWCWSILAEKLVLVKFGPEKWVWSILAGKTGF